MPMMETVTIINNSGKIISTGKQLLGIFKEARASYQEKKAALKSERAPAQRAQTFDVVRPPTIYDEHVEYVDPYRLSDGRSDGRSRAPSHRSHGSRRSRSTARTSRDHRSEHPKSIKARPALTESNLKTLSEVSSTRPSRPPVTYRSPYCETAPRDLALSKPTLARAPTESIASGAAHRRQSVLVPRTRSDPDMRKKDLDEHLAYGNVPPDLATRYDLDPEYQAAEKERKAKNLVGMVEKLLDEAHCVQHTATSIIAHLQNNPEAAAAVALTLAELSTLLSKMSPAFLGIIKGGSPAVFALLASPQFLIAAGVTVGVTVVMFGGWKIIKRIKEAKTARADAAMAFEGMQPGPMPAVIPPYPPTDPGFDEALVLEEELSTIETWRRGIVPYGDDASADLELISPEADRATRAMYDDAASRGARTHRSSRTHKSHRSRRPDEDSIPERRSSAGKGQASIVREGSVAGGSERSHRSSRSKRTDRVELKAIEDGRSTRAGDKDNEVELALRPKDRKGSMLKTLFKKKKDKEEAERVSVLV